MLRLCRVVALLVMRPRRFFVFNEMGGFWLDRRDRWPQPDLHPAGRWQAWVSCVRTLGRGLLWLTLLPTRLGRWLARASVQLALLLYAALFFIPAILLLALLRTTYDTYFYRFRLFGKSARAPRREL